MSAWIIMLLALSTVKDRARAIHEGAAGATLSLFS